MGGSEITQFGKILIPCQHKRGKFNCIFYVTDAVGTAILGIKTCRALELVHFIVHWKQKVCKEKTSLEMLPRGLAKRK